MNQTQTCFLSLLREAIHGQESADPSLSQPEWEQIFRTADAHNLLPMILDHAANLPSCRLALRRDKSADAGSNDAPAVLWQERAIQQLGAQVIQENEFLNFVLKLRERGVEPLVMKGPVCRSLYPKPWLRPSVDDDFLVKENQAENCRACLKDCGFSPYRKEVNPEQAWEQSYVKAAPPLHVEMHKFLFDPNSPIFSRFNQAFEGAFGRSESILVQDISIQTFAPADHLLFLILHAFKHFLFSGFGIRIVADICLFTERYAEQIDVSAIAQRCEAVRALPFTAAVYQIGERELGIPAPEPFAGLQVELEPLLEDVMNSGIHGGQFERLHSANITLGALEANMAGKKSGAGLRRALFPPADALAASYLFAKKYPVLLPLAWIRRALDYLVSARKNKKKQIVREPIRVGRERVRLLESYGVIS